MDLAIGFGIFLFFLIVAAIFYIPTIWAVAAGMVCFSILARKRGFSYINILKMYWKGIKKSAPVLGVFVLIGIMTGVWRASGTIAFFMYYGVKFSFPHIFILTVFLLSSFISYTIGTSFGTAATLGVVLMLIAESGGVSIPITAGAIISGAYFGDRGAPTSSSANLVAVLTRTDLYGNVKRMMKFTVIPFLLTCLIFLIFSIIDPLESMPPQLDSELTEIFQMSWVVFLPAAAVLILPLFRMGVKKAMGISIILSALIAYFVQGICISDLLNTALFGFELEGPLGNLLSGGGLSSMVSVMLFVLVSSTYSGIFEETQMLKGIECYVEKISTKIGEYSTTVFISSLTSLIACNQTLVIMMTEEIMEPIYRRHNKSMEQLALDIENTAVTIAGLVPWSIACAVPLAMVGAKSNAVCYCCYLYILPIYGIFFRRREKSASVSVTI